MAYRDVCPQDLRFTQDSIAIKFKPPYQSLRIDNAVVQICNGELSPTVFSPLNVVHHRNVLWCLDNRRLWVLRKARVATVEIKLVPPNFSERSSDFFNNLDQLVENQYSSPHYFPVVRGRVRSVGINSRNNNAAEQSNNVGAPPPPLPNRGEERTVPEAERITPVRVPSRVRVPAPVPAPVRVPAPVPVPAPVRVPARVRVPAPVPANLVSPVPNISEQPTKAIGHERVGKEEPSIWPFVLTGLAVCVVVLMSL